MDSTAARGGAVMTEAGGGRDPGASSLSCPAPPRPRRPERGVSFGARPPFTRPSASRFRGSPLQLHFSAEHGRDLQRDRVFLPRCPFLLICTGHRPRRGSTRCLS